MIMDCWGGAKIRCEFSKTQINTDNIVLKTIFHNVPDSTLYVKPETIRKEVEQAFFDAATVLTDFSIKDTVKIDKPYTYLYVNESGKVVAVSVNSNGKTEEKTTEISATNLKENTLIQGKNGEELVLTKKGQVMGKSEFNATGGNSVLLKEYHRKSDSLAQWQINFSKYDAQTYAFDYLGSGNHGIFSSSEYYPQVGSYDFRYKSVECGKNDKVIVEFDTYPQADSVVFKDKYGVTYPVSLKDNVLSFTGVSKADTNYIYAYRGDKKVGKLFLNTYQRKIYKVVFVRVNGAAKKLNEEKVQEHLNKVYNQCAVKFEIETAKLDLPDLTSFSHGGSGILTVYNEDQKKVLRAYDKEMKDGVYYLFFVDNVTDKKDGSGTPVSGYMPRGYNCGFIYDGGSERTIAHELGHGIGNLEHVFSASNFSGKTQNLMDYSAGTELYHFQWNEIQDPSRVWLKWRKEESEGESIKKASVVFSKRLDFGNGNYTNNYGYDDLDTKDDTNDDHINVKLHDGITYLNVKFKGIKSNEVTFISEDINISTCDYLGDINVLQIKGGSKQGEIRIIALPSELTIDWDNKEYIQRQQIIKDNSLGQIWVNVYNLMEIKQTINYSSFNNNSLNNFKSLAEKYLKEIVAKPIFSFITNPDLSFDKNSNGIIERFMNSPKDPYKQDWDEYHSLAESIRDKNEIFLIKCRTIYDKNWYIGCSINKKDTKIVFHERIFKQFDDYIMNNNKVLTIHDYDGQNSEDFVVQRIDLSNPAQPTLIITTNLSDPSYSQGFAYSHSEMSVITDRSAMSIGFSSNDPNSGAVVLEQETDEITGQTLLHEIMHNFDKDVYFDVVKPGNLMHYNKNYPNTNTVIKITKPFEYSPLPEFDDTKNIFTGKKKSQWYDKIR